MLRDIGNSPSVEAGAPRGVRDVGSLEEMLKRERVFEPGFTARRFCELLVLGCPMLDAS